MKIVILALVLHFYVFITVIYTDSPKKGHLFPSTSNLSCYTCSTIENRDCKVINETYYYQNSKYSTFNTRLFGSECKSTEQFCAVLRLDAKIDQSSFDYKFWAIERKCSDECVDGCFVMGERTKLSLCTTCCTTNYCNIGNTSRPIITCNIFFMLFLLILSIVCN